MQNDEVKTTAYQADFDLWLKQTVQLLQAERWQELDVENLVEEIEGLSKSERRGIASQLTRLILHLLKWQFQPQKRSDSWLDSITDARTQIDLALKDSPSLSDYSVEQLEQSYQRARRQAAKQTQLEITAFPVECPYLLADILSDDWLPK